MTIRRRQVQYHAFIHSPGANGGPGQLRLDLTPDMLYCTWQRSMNLGGAASFTLVRGSSKVADIAPHRDHLFLYRESPADTRLVWQGKVGSRNIAAGDVVFRCLDYTSYLQRSRTGWKTLYPTKKIGTEIISPEWALVLATADGPLNFVTAGTIEDPLAVDDVTPITTNARFGMMAFERLFVFFALAEMGMANTTNNVVFEITVDPTTPTFNLWKNRSVDRSTFALYFPGNLRAFNYDPGELDVTNDLASVIKKAAGGSELYSVDDAASIALYRRLQAAVTIQTLMGLDTSAIESDQQKAALARLLRDSIRLPRLFIALPRYGEVDPFNGWNLGDNFPVVIEKAGAPDTDELAQYLRCISIAAAWTPEAGEQLQLFMRAKET